MTFDEVLAQVQELLQREQRVSYRGLKRRFALDDEYLEDLKEELIGAKRLATDEEGRFLVWTGAAPVSSSKFQVQSSPQPPTPQTPNPELRTSQSPAVYTPPHLAERIRAEQAALEARGSTDGERKTITALFADLKGSTALIEGLDPEEARAIIDPALQVMMDAVHRYDGYVAQALGDGIFALFGAPLAHEDHPQRALYAALLMQDEMRRYADTLRAKGYPPLLMRVGVNTGEVVARSIRKDDLHADYVPVGHSTNLAARMEQLAAPGSILVTDYTHKLTDGYFEFKNLGKTQIKGVEEPLNVYEVLVEQGQGEEGIARMHQGLAASRVTGSELFRTYFLALLVEGYGKAGQPEKGLAALAEALATVDKTGEQCYEAELYRLKGELLLAQEIKSQNSKGKSQKSENPNPQSAFPNPQSQAEACFFKAIEIARRQSAKSWELRAVMSLARLWRQQAAQDESRTTHHEAHAMLDEAHKMLSEIYNWFTEGFDTKDLQEAQALIEELSHRAIEPLSH